MRTMGLDYGEARIGVALSDPTGLIASPHGVIAEKNQGEQVRKVMALVTETGAEQLVVGLPLQMDGQAGPMAERAEKFATKLELVTGLTVHRWDERLTSVAAERVIAESRSRGRGRRGRTGGKQKGDVDKLAATFILQGFLDSRGG